MPHKHQRLHRALEERAPMPALITSNGVVVSVVYVTAQPTFTGVIGGYSTLTQGDSNTQDSDQSTNTRRIIAPNTLVSASSAQSIQSSALSARISSQSLLASSATALTSSAALLLPSSSSSSNYYATGSSSQATSTSTASDTSPSGMSIDTKLGLAVGIVCVIGIITILPLIILARKRKQRRDQAQVESEKTQPPYRPSPSQQAAPEAPRLSLRPVSSLVPEFMGGAKPKSRNSHGNLLTPISEMSKGSRSPSPAIALVERPRAGDNPFKDPENPFADPEKAGAAHAGINSYPLNSASAIVTTAAPGGSLNSSPMDQRSPEPRAEAFPLPQSQSQAQPTPLNVSSPYTAPSAAMASGVAPVELPGAPAPTIAQGPGGDAPPSSVYRILLDFRPTMEDELELRAGQLVRLLHEYDDGWALCIRLDRSQQGVVPRTCLAAKPSKPRPGAPHVGPSSRPVTPQGQPRGPGPRPQGPGFPSPRVQGPVPVRSQSPAQMRGQSPGPGSPTTGAFNQPPRPLSPGPRPQGQKRSMSPGPYGANGPRPMAPPQQRRRSNSASATNARRNSPPGPSKLGPGSPTVRSDSPGLAI